ncbi:MAG: HEAT repeat domain-containing protein [Smithella sp.]
MSSLKNEDAGARKVAAWSLGYIGHPRAVKPLIDALKDKNREVREYAVKALGDIGDKEAVPVLIDMFINMKERDFRIDVYDEEKDYANHMVFWEIGRALAKLKDPRAGKPLAEAMYKDYMLLTAAETLEKIGPPVVEPLLDILAGKHKLFVSDKSVIDAKGRAAKALGVIRDSRAFAPLVKECNNEDALGVPDDALSALADFGPMAVQPFIEMLKSDDHELASVAVTYLGYIGDPRAIEPLIEIEKQNTAGSKMRQVTISALSHFNDKRSIETLISILKEDSYDGYQAGRSLKKIDPPVIEYLKPLLKHNDPIVRRNLLVASGDWTRDIYFIDIYKSGLTDQDAKARCNAITGLYGINSYAKADDFITMLNDEDVCVRRVASKSLGIYKDTRAAKPLCKLLQDTDGEVRENATRSLSSINDPDSVPCLIGALKDRNSSVRKYAVIALGDIGDPSAVEPILQMMNQDDSGIRDVNQRKKYRQDNYFLTEEVIKALGRLKDSRAVDLLTDILSNDDIFKYELKQSLKMITGKEY